MTILNSFEDFGIGMRKVLIVLSFILLIHGTVGFSMFVFEEAMQTAMFASFAYANAENWLGLEEHIEVMKSIDSSSRTWFIYVGWLAPVMYPAYMSYLEGNRSFIKSQEALVRAYK